MKLFALLTLAVALTTPKTFAADDKGIEEAFAVCNTIPFASDKEDCQATVNKAAYFQPSLTKLCGEQFPHDVKGKCLALVADKTAYDTAIKGCKDKRFWDDLSSCLSKITKPYVAAAPAAPAADEKTCKKDKVSDLVNSAITRAKKLQYLDMYDSLVQLRAQLTLCGFE